MECWENLATMLAKVLRKLTDCWVVCSMLVFPFHLSHWEVWRHAKLCIVGNNLPCRKLCILYIRHTAEIVGRAPCSPFPAERFGLGSPIAGSTRSLPTKTSWLWASSPLLTTFTHFFSITAHKCELNCGRKRQKGKKPLCFVPLI